MNKRAYGIKKGLSRGMACLLAAVMLLSASGVPGALAESEGLLPESETPVVSEVTESSTDSLQTEGTPEGTGDQTGSSASEAETETLGSVNEQDTPVNGVNVLTSQANGELASGTDEENGAVEAAAASVTYEDESDLLNATNWMSGISDDRRLNEINIPGTHDSGCFSVWARTKLARDQIKKAITQDQSIPDQLDAGVRLLDLRWTNCHSCINNADFDELFECHGSYRTILDVDLMYYCLNDQGKFQYFDRVMDQVCSFLDVHPSETVILNMQVEYDDEKQYSSTVEKDIATLKKMGASTASAYPKYLQDAYWYYRDAYDEAYRTLKAEYQKQGGYGNSLIDPDGAARTSAYNAARAFLYKQNYSVFAFMKNQLKDYSNYLYTGSTVPTLGEVRGKAVLVCKDSDNILGCGIKIGCGNQIGSVSAGGVDFIYQNCWDKDGTGKGIVLYEFLNRYNTRLPEVGEHTTRGYINYSSSSVLSSNPRDISEFPNAILYMQAGEEREEYEAEIRQLPIAYMYKNQYPNFGQLGLFDERGRHFGWVYSDFVHEDMARMLWLTNFPSGLRNGTVTYKNGEEVIDTQKAILGSSVEIRAGLPSEDYPKPGYGFAGWKDSETGKIYQPGEKGSFAKDAVLEACWEMTWESLREGIRSALSTPTTFTLPTDITAAENSEPFLIGSASQNITIDLNGHSIDGKTKAGTRQLFQVEAGTLTITDSSDTGAGTLSGGSDETGGAILIEGGNVTLENITVTGNHAETTGGAICISANEKETIPSLTLKNVSITENSAGSSGAGICLVGDAVLKIEGNVQIHGNTLKGASNPLYEGLESNLYLDNSLQNDSSVGFVTVSGSLDPESEIGVSLAKGPAIDEEIVITRGLNGNGSVNSVLSDLNRYEVLNRNGEAVFLGRALTVNYDPNGATSGSVPMDPNIYDDGDTATVLGNTGNLLRRGVGFIGWNTEADGSGEDYSAGDTIAIVGAVTLYAQWAAASVTTQDGKTTIYSEFKDAVKNWVNGSTLKLLGDVETDEILYIRQNSLTLDLNGYGIRHVNAGMILFVYDGKELNIKDSAPDRAWSGENRPEGVTGGYLTGGYADGRSSDDRGGAVQVQGTLNMSGGTITGNRAIHYGGGVYVYGKFRMSGGAITGNSANYSGGGVYVQTGATIEVSGSARIANNTESGSVVGAVSKPDNVYLKNGSTISVGALDIGAAFGVTMAEPGLFTRGAAFDDDAAAQAYFTSDDDAYTVQRSDDSQGTLRKNAPVTYIHHTAYVTTAPAVTRRCEGYTLLGTGNHEEAITVTDGWVVVTDDVTVEKPIVVSGTVGLILCDGATLTAKEGITVNAGDTLNIYPGSMDGSVEGTGRLTAGTANGAAGIGGSYGNQGGTIAIHGGTVVAPGNRAPGNSAAGIGGGEQGAGGTVIIYDGTVNATGGMEAAGIGGGYGGDGGDVTVYGGTITATTGSYGAGIGGGSRGHGGTVKIYGGTVKTNAKGRFSGYYLGVAHSEGIGKGSATADNSSGILILGKGMYLYGADTANPENDIIHNHIELKNDDYARNEFMTVNSEPPHEHSIVYSVSEDGVSLLAQCETVGCELHDHPSRLTLVAPTDTTVSDDGETVETDPVYDGTAKLASPAVDGQTTLWDNVVYTYQKQNPVTGEWENLPKVTYTEKTENELGEVTETEVEMDGVPVDAGTYRFSASLISDGTDPVEAAVEFTIRQRPVTVTAVDQTVLSIDRISEAYSKIRTGEGELVDGHEVFGFYLTPSPDAEGTEEGDIIPSNLVIYAGLTDVTANYDITYVNGKFYVRENAASVTAAPAAKENLVYDGNPQELVTAGTAEGGEMHYALGEEKTSVPLDGWDDKIPTAAGAGTWYVWYRVVGDDSHTDTEPSGPVPVTIGQRTAELNWTNTELTYNGSAQAPMATVSNLAGDTSWIDSCEVTVVGAQTDAGTYTAAASALSNANYALPEDSTVAFTIAKAAGEIRFAEDSVTKQYGDEAFTVELTNSGDGTVTYTSDNQNVATVDAATGTVTIVSAGEATITATVQDGKNYSYATKEAAFTLTVTRKAAEIRFAQASVNRLYGSSPFANALENTGDGTVTYSSDNTAVASVDAASGMVTIAGAGEATITATVTDGATSAYDVKTASFRLTIRKADNPGYAAGSATVTKGGNTVSLRDYIKNAQGTVSYAIKGEALGCTVADDGTFTSGNEPGIVTVTVTMSGNENYIQKTVDLTVDVVEKQTRSAGASAIGRPYGEPLNIPISIPVPPGESPNMHYTGTLRSGVAYDSDEDPTEAGDYHLIVTYEDDTYIWTEQITLGIHPRELGVPEVTLGEALTYNGSEQTQTVAAVMWYDIEVPAVEYTVTDNTGTDAGTYTLSITAKPTGNYTGSFTKDFTISKADPAYTIPEGLTADVGDTLDHVALPSGWTWADRSLSVGESVGPHTFKANYTPADTKNYNTVENVDVTVTVMASAAFTREPAVKEGLSFNESRQDLITAGEAAGGTVQYALSADGTTAFTKDWSEEIPTGYDAGTYYVWYRIVGAEYYRDLEPQGPLTVIIAKAEAEISYTETALAKAYGDAAFTNELTDTGDGTVSYRSNDTSVATVSESGQVTIRGVGETTITATAVEGTNYSYAGNNTASYTLTVKAALTEATLSAKVLKYTGSEQTVSIRSVKAGVLNVPADAYTVTGNTGIDAGTYTVTVTAKENSFYTGSCTVSFSIVEKSADFLEVTLDKTEFTWTGEEIRPAVTVKDGNTVLTEGTEYTLRFSNNVNAGTGRVLVTGLTYAGSQLHVFTIQKADSAVTSQPATKALTWNGTAQELVTAGDTTGGTMQYALGTDATSAPADDAAWSDAIPAGTNAGNYDVWYRVVGDANHNDTAAAGPVTVSIEKVEAAFLYETTAVEKTYGDAAFTNPLTNTGDGTVTYTSGDETVATVDANGLVTIVGAGETTITAALSDANPNYTYTAAQAEYQLTVAKGSAAFTETPYPMPGLIYDGTPWNLVIPGEATGGTMQYALGAVGENAPAEGWRATVPTGTEPGTYYVWYRVVGDEHYTGLAAQGPVTVTIGKAVGTVSFAETSVVKLLGDPAFTNELTNSGDGAVTYSSSDTSVATVDVGTGEVAIVGVGTTTITATVTDGAYFSYAITTAGYALTVSDEVLLLPAFLTRIEEEAFAGTGAVIIEVPENVTAIEARAFADCENLRRITIPGSVLHVDNTALENCENVTVYGATGSEAQRFAGANGFTFVDPDLS